MSKKSGGELPKFMTFNDEVLTLSVNARSNETAGSHELLYTVFLDDYPNAILMETFIVHILMPAEILEEEKV